MAVKSIQLGKELKAEREPNTFRIDPTELKLGVNSRHLDGGKLSAKEVAEDQERAVSIFEFGQKVPCIVYRSGKETVLTAGFGRYRSVLQIREGFEINGQRYHDPNFPLLVAVDESIVDEKAAFVASVLENVRKEVNPYAVALAQKKLIDEYKYNMTEVAHLYGYDNTNAVSRSLKLLESPPELQKAVKTGQVALSVALEIAKLPEEQQKDTLDQVKAGQKVRIADVIAAQAEHLERNTEKTKDDTDPTPAKGATGKSPKRNASALVKLIDGVLADEQTPCPDKVRNLLRGINEYLAGEKTERTVLKRLDELCDSVK